MSSATANSRRRTGRAAVRRSQARRRRLAILLAVVVGIVAAGYLAGRGPVEEAVREITLPLKHEDIIRQQARDKDLDPALIAAVIYQESKFQDRTSPAGARGLMQITPATAHFIADKSGGTRFTTADLSTPQINISYGSWYLRWLIDHYDGNETLAIAAYNAGQTPVNEWVERAGGEDRFVPARHIRFPETRAYVANVFDHQKQYRRHYARELGLD